eukprot:364234-Chlamydomonas_euryale.AAC.11
MLLHGLVAPCKMKADMLSGRTSCRSVGLCLPCLNDMQITHTLHYLLYTLAFADAITSICSAAIIAKSTIYQAWTWINSTPRLPGRTLGRFAQ